METVNDDSIMDLWKSEPLMSDEMDSYQYQVVSRSDANLGTTYSNTTNPMRLMYQVPAGTEVDIDNMFALAALQMSDSGGACPPNIGATAESGGVNITPHGWGIIKSVNIKLNGTKNIAAVNPGMLAATVSLLTLDRDTIRSIGPAEQFFPLESMETEVSAVGTYTFASGAIDYTGVTPAISGPNGDSTDDTGVGSNGFNAQFFQGFKSLLTPLAAGAAANKGQMGTFFVKLMFKRIAGICNIGKAIPLSQIEIELVPDTTAANYVYGNYAVTGGNGAQLGVKFVDLKLFVPLITPGKSKQVQILERFNAGEKIPINYLDYKYLSLVDGAGVASFNANFSVGSQVPKYVIVYPQFTARTSLSNGSHLISGIDEDWSSSQLLIEGQPFPILPYQGSATNYTQELQVLYDFANRSLDENSSWITPIRYRKNSTGARMYPYVVFDLSRVPKQLQLQKANATITFNHNWAAAPGASVTYHIFYMCPQYNSLDPKTGFFSLER